MGVLRSPTASDFDPVSEGTRYRLVAAISLAVWDGVCRESTLDDGQRDEQQARQRTAHNSASHLLMHQLENLSPVHLACHPSEM